MRLPILAFLVMICMGVFGSTAFAQQPSTDTIRISTNGCNVNIRWSDGTQDAVLLKVSVNAVFRDDIDIDDVVGDQSATLSSFTAPENAEIIARLFVDGEELPSDTDTKTVGKCPTATPTATNTPVQSSATPTTGPTVVVNTPVPPTPVVVFVPAPAPQVRVDSPVFVEVNIPTQPVVVSVPAAPAQVVRNVISPPSTGDGNLK